MGRMILGADPGNNGAIAVLDGEELVEVYDMPTIDIKVGGSIKRRISAELLASELRNHSEAVAIYIEGVSSSPQMGVASAFSFGEGFGMLKGVAAALQIPMVLVPPARWKRDMKLNSSKDGSRAMAIQLWPSHAQEFKLVKHADRAEAALIAEWGRRFHKVSV